MKRKLIGELLEITKYQSELLEKEKIEEYIEALDKRQVILDELKELYIKNPEIKNQDASDLLDELKKVDNLNRIEFQRQFEDTKNKLREIRALKKNHGQYANPYTTASEEGVFFDKKNV